MTDRRALIFGFLCDLGVSAVKYLNEFHRRVAEYAEAAQRNTEYRNYLKQAISEGLLPHAKLELVISFHHSG